MAKDLTKYTADSVKTMTALEFMRENASMMLGNLNLDANIQCMLENLLNSEDEIIEDRPYWIKMILFKGRNTYQFALVDWGRGVPSDNDAMKRIYMESYTSGKYSQSGGYHVSNGAWGIGVKQCVAVSNFYVSYSNRREAFGIIRMDKGKLTDYQINKPIIGPDGQTGTTIVYQPDDSILSMTNTFWNSPEGYQRLLDIVDYHCCFKKNDNIEVHVVDHLLSDKFFKQDYYEQWKYFQEVQGKIVYRTEPGATPMSYVNRKFDVKEAPAWSIDLVRDIDVSKDDQNGGFVICLNKTKHRSNASIIGTVNFNFISKYDSSHIKVALDVIKDKLVKYLPEDDDELKVYFTQKWQVPLYGSIQVIWKGAKYAGQTKDAFFNKEFESLYAHELKARCDQFSDEHWENLYELLKDELMDDFSRNTNRSLNIGKSLKNISASLNNDCYTPCRLKDPTVTELFITEGDSAGNWVKQARDPAFQAILKLRGKPLNAFDADMARIKANAVLQDMIRIIGVSPRDTDLSNMNFRRIGIMADPDPDGYHIVCLVLGNLYKINPLILSEGRVFVTNPPLFNMEKKGVELSLRDRKSLNDARVKIYSNYLDMYMLTYNPAEIELAEKERRAPKSNVEPRRLTDEGYRDLVYFINRIGNLIKGIANELVIEPLLLEQLVHCVDDLNATNINTEAIKYKLQLTDCVYNNLANTITLVDHDVETIVSLNKLVYQIRSFILPLLKEVHWEYFDILVSTKQTDTYNKTPLTFMQLFQIFQTIDTAYPVSLFKGLGEISIDLLKTTCCDPKTRSISTVTSLGDATEFMKMLGSSPDARKQLVIKDLRSMKVPEEFIQKI